MTAMFRIVTALAIVVLGVYFGTRLVANGTLSEPVALIATVMLVGPLAMLVHPPGYETMTARKRRHQREVARRS